MLSFSSIRRPLAFSLDRKTCYCPYIIASPSAFHGVDQNAFNRRSTLAAADENAVLTWRLRSCDFKTL